MFALSTIDLRIKDHTELDIETDEFICLISHDLASSARMDDKAHIHPTHDVAAEMKCT